MTGYPGDIPPSLAILDRPTSGHWCQCEERPLSTGMEIETGLCRDCHAINREAEERLIRHACADRHAQGWIEREEARIRREMAVERLTVWTDGIAVLRVPVWVALGALFFGLLVGGRR